VGSAEEAQRNRKQLTATATLTRVHST